MYRTQLPKQIDAYKKAAYGALPEQAKGMWGQMYANLNQRGRDETPGFLGGARQDWAQWRMNEKRAIEDTAQAMQQQGQQAMLQALGRPNYGGIFQGWGQHNQQMNKWLFDQWKAYQTARANR